MKKRYFALLFCALLQLGTLMAQDFTNYEPIRAQGKLPQSFLKSSHQKAVEEMDKTIKANKKQPFKHKKKEFLENNNFIIDEMLLSGKVLFNDPIGTYVNKVVDTLLKGDPALRKQIDVYIIKSSALNAFTTSRGTIFVNMGLIARMKNEAELAYILSHEIIHYKNKHVLNEFERSETIRRDFGLFRNKSITEDELSKSMYSKSLESEADVQGLGIYLKSRYKISELKGVFDELQYAGQPYGNTTFNKSFFESNNYRMPGSYQLKETRQVHADDSKERYDTHPQIKMRRDTILKLIKGMKDNGRQDYLVGKTEFENIREMSRFELNGIYLENRMYEATIYNSFLLSKGHPNNKYLDKCITEALYGLNKYASSGRFSEIHNDYTEIQGKQQEVYYIFSIMDPKEIAILASNYSWRMKKKYPDDEEISAITEDNFKILVDHYFSSRTFFSAFPDTVVEKDTLPKRIDFKSTSITPELKFIKRKLTSRNHYKIVIDTAAFSLIDVEKPLPQYCKFAFVDYMKDEDFRTYFDTIAQGKKERADVKEKASKNNSSEKSDDWMQDYMKNHPNPEIHGISKMVFVNPFYYKVDSRKDLHIQSRASEEAEKEFSNSIGKLATLSGLKYEIIDKKNLGEDSAADFNDIADLSTWVEEFYDHGNTLDYVNFKNEKFDAIIKKYNTPYFCWTGIAAVRQENLGAFKLIASCFFPPLIPLALYKTFEPKYTTVQYTVVMNLATGKMEYLKVKEYKINDRPDVIKSCLYDFFKHLKPPASGNETTSN